jgi:hypothetical protein
MKVPNSRLVEHLVLAPARMRGTSWRIQFNETDMGSSMKVPTSKTSRTSCVSASLSERNFMENSIDQVRP